MFPEEGSGLHQGHADVPPLEGGQQEVRPDLPESGRRQSLRPRREEGPGGPDGRYAEYLASDMFMSHKSPTYQEVFTLLTSIIGADHHETARSPYNIADQLLRVRLSAAV